MHNISPQIIGKVKIIFLPGRDSRKSNTDASSGFLDIVRNGDRVVEQVGIYQLHGEDIGVTIATRPRNRAWPCGREITGNREVDGKGQREEEDNNTVQWVFRKDCSNGTKLRYLRARRIMCKGEEYKSYRKVVEEERKECEEAVAVGLLIGVRRAA